MKGFTLVEVLVSAALAGILMMGIYATMLSGTAVYLRDTAMLDLQQDARNGMDRIVREVRASQASTITVVSTDADQISFSTPTKAGVQYYLSGTQLIREYPSGTQTPLATHIARLKFSKTSAFLEIEMEARTSLYGQTIVFPLRENVRLRNE